MRGITSKAASDAYREGWERAFGDKKRRDEEALNALRERYEQMMRDAQDQAARLYWGVL